MLNLPPTLIAEVFSGVANTAPDCAVPVHIVVSFPHTFPTPIRSMDNRSMARRARAGRTAVDILRAKPVTVLLCL